MGEWINSTLESDLEEKGAYDATAPYRSGSRLLEAEGGIYLRLTIVHCDSMEHILANREFLCPYASVVEVPGRDASCHWTDFSRTAITKDETFTVTRSFQCGASEYWAHLDYENFMDQPHEGNMFGLQAPVHWNGRLSKNSHFN